MQSEVMLSLAYSVTSVASSSNRKFSHNSTDFHLGVPICLQNLEVYTFV
jgi:hypothetical protein